jgi:hypothetical protein
MSLPPSGPTVAPVGQPVYLQVDWWIGSGTPPGAYPGALVSQAITAGIAGSVTAIISGLVAIGTQTFEAAEGINLPGSSATKILDLTTVAYPSGTALANYNTAIVQVGVLGGTLISLWAEDAAGNEFYVQSYTAGGDSLTAAIPIAGMTSLWAQASTGSPTVSISVSLTQEVVPSPSVVTWSPTGGPGNVGSLVPVPVQVVGQQSVLSPGVLMVGTLDANNYARNLPTTAGGAAVVTQEDDGTASARALQALSAAGTSTTFGPTAARQSLWFTLTVSIYGVTCTGAGAVEIQLADTTTGQVIASMLVTIPVTANFPAAGVQSSIAGELNYPHQGAAAGDFELNTLVNGTVTGLAGRCVAVVGYR